MPLHNIVANQINSAGNGEDMADGDDIFVAANVLLESTKAGGFGIGSSGHINDAEIYGFVYGADGIDCATGGSDIHVGASGTVSGSVTAIDVLGEGNYVSNAGEISGPRAIFFEGDFGDLANSGTIRGTVQFTDSSNTVRNSGTIMADKGNAIEFDGSGAGNGNLVDNSGTISAGLLGYSITNSQTYPSLTVVNTGQILGDMLLNGTDSLDVTNSGAISGFVSLDGGTVRYDGTLGTISGGIGVSGVATILGGAGSEHVYIGSDFTPEDSIDGGGGSDTLQLQGSGGQYTTLMRISSVMMRNVETLRLTGIGGHPGGYTLSTDDDVVAAGQTLTVDGTPLSGGLEPLIFDGSAETDGHFILEGGDSNDTLTGGALGDTLNIVLGGIDTASSGGGNDLFYLGAALTAADRIDGGAGIDIGYLTGDYATVPLVFGATTMVNVERLILSAGFNYNLIINDATVASGQTLLVNASALGAANTFAFNGGAETNGGLLVTGGAGSNTITGGGGADTLTGGGSADTLNIARGGADTVNAGGGNDLIYFGAALNTADKVDGGAGTDIAYLTGDYATTPLVFGATTMVNVERLILSAGSNYTLTTNNATVASGQTLLVDASALGAANHLVFNGTVESDGHFTIVGGAGSDTITGGSGGDRFVYGSAAPSTSTHFDRLAGVDFAIDRFDIPGNPGTVTGIDATIGVGSLSVATFDTDLHNVLNGSANHLAADHAILFRPNTGNYAGQYFLVVDVNGHAGYDAGADLVFHLTGQTGALTTGDFI
jgi:hypothetical protein